MTKKEERAVRRYLQIAELEMSVRQAEGSIDRVQAEIADAEDRLKELRKTKSELMKDLRAAARDEGQLPLFGDLEAVLDVALVEELLQAAAPAPPEGSGAPA